MIFALCASPAVAQQAIIDRCKQTSSDADRIACLEAALLGREYRAPEPASGKPSIRPAAEDADKEPVGIGAEQVIARTRDGKAEPDAARGLEVAGYDYVPYRKLVVTLENGQVWRQIKGDTRYVRVNLERNQTVDITESAMSGYTLRLNEMQREVRVERVR